ncbi:UvrB/UvrC motif-containing protein [Novosphingobium kaempferiae]|uniref:UvrB/UvrC motif-containing protein n=1 Tax=Novosphingobium kaempferiae TaxID=2896849 RepID=UPI003084587F
MGTGSSRPVSVAASSTPGARRHAGRRTSPALGIQVTEPHEKRLQALHTAMHSASAQTRFERAAKLRDQISLLRGLPVNASGPAEDFGPSGLVRQRPGAMGLGTSREDVKPPSGWKPPESQTR